MRQVNTKNSSLWESQYARLGYFLIASSFLVATFAQIVTTEEEISILVHAIAGLGSSIAALYFFMNFWLSMPDWLARHIHGAESTHEQLIHTWFIPLLFLTFWLVVWINVIDIWWAPPLGVLVFLKICLIFQICRYRETK